MMAGSIPRVKKKKKKMSFYAYLVFILSNYLPALPTTIAQGVSIGIRKDRGIGPGYGAGNGLRHQYVIKPHLFRRL